MNRSVSVIGLGYIGLPLAMSLCEKGFYVVGVDVDTEKVEMLQKGLTNVMEECDGVPLQEVLRKHLQGRGFHPTTRVAVAAWETSAYIVTVGVPVHRNGQLNTHPLIAAMEQLGRVIKPNDLVLIRSTVSPGMVEELCVPILEQTSRMRPGEDFHVAYAAERVAEGRAMREFQTLDVVVGGLTERCVVKAAELLGQLTSGKIHVTDLRTAQAVKVVENVQRDLNIALAHELSRFAEFHNIDVYELIRMANTHPRVQLLQPGIGVGGFCIPNAYHYMRHSLGSALSLPLLQLARNINQDAPARVVEAVEQGLLSVGKPLSGTVVAILGLGMKDNSNDVRESPAVVLADLLRDRGAVVRAYDPLVPLQFPFQTKTLKQCLYKCDALVVATWHDVFAEEDFPTALGVRAHECVIYDRKRHLQPYLESPQCDRKDVVTA